MSFVDLTSDVRWTTADRRNRTEALVASQVPPEVERILIRRTVSFVLYVVAQMLPADHPLRASLSAMGRPLDPDQATRLMAAVQVFGEVDALADQADADIALLNRVLDAEQGIALLADDDTAGYTLLAMRAALRPPELSVDTQGGEA